MNLLKRFSTYVERRSGCTLPIPDKRYQIMVDQDSATYFESSKVHIETFVFFDLETTGLLKFVPNSSRAHIGKGRHPGSDYIAAKVRAPTVFEPRITEMSFHAVQRSTFFRCVTQLNKKRAGETLKCKVPTNVFTAQVNPELSEEEWRQYNSDRLKMPDIFVHDRADLLLKNNFLKEFKALRVFLSNLRPPICLVAHNGARFDFPVLFREVARCSNDLCEFENGVFPQNTYLLDSYYALQSLECSNLNDISKLSESINWTLLAESTIEINSSSENESNDNDIIDHSFNVLARIEGGRSTNTRPRTPPPVNTAQRNEIHPSTIIKEEGRWSPAKKQLLREPTTFKKVNNDWVVEQGRSRSYALKSVYTRVVGDNYISHYASDDAMALMEVSLAFGSAFITYADENAVSPPF